MGVVGLDAGDALACWWFDVYPDSVPRPQRPQSIIIRASVPWTTVDPVGACTFFDTLILHEAGHAYGLSHATNMHSIMQESPRNICYPSKYDIVATMANYQSR